MRGSGFPQRKLKHSPISLVAISCSDGPNRKPKRFSAVGMQRRDFIAGIVGSAATWPLAARGQLAPKTHFVLWVSTEAQPDPFIAGFREGMRERGYVEGQNLAFVLRYAPGDPARLRAALPELLSVPTDLIVSSGAPGGGMPGMKANLQNHFASGAPRVHC